MASAAKSALVKISTTAGGAGTYSICAGLNSASASRSGNMLDTTAFISGGASMVTRVQGLKDMSYSLSGTYESTDTTGQTAIYNSWLNDSTCWITYLPDGVAGWKQQVLVSKFENGTSVDGVSTVSIELQGTGTITAV